LVHAFSTAPIFAPVVVAGVAWWIFAAAMPSLPVLGPLAALLILFAGLCGLNERRNRRRLLTQSRTIAGIQGLKWGEFEDLLVEVFHREGYRVEKTAEGPDGGVDHILRRAGTVTFVQAKHWNRRQVPLSVVQRTYGVAKAGRASRAMVVTCGTFSADAIAFARDLSGEVDLVDGHDLLDRMAQRGLADRLTRPRSVPTAPLPGLADEPCPRCGADMEVKNGRFGLFLSCVRYPSCRGSLPVRSRVGPLRN
jgi:restriction system protein